MLPQKMIAFQTNNISTNTSTNENVKSYECSEAIPLVAHIQCNTRLAFRTNHFKESIINNGQRQQNKPVIIRGKSQNSPKKDLVNYIDNRSQTNCQQQFKAYTQRTLGVLHKHKVAEVQAQEIKNTFENNISILDSFFEKERLQFIPNYKPLNGHQISDDYRTKMVDWMIEVCTSFSCSDRTWFLAVTLFDRYLYL